MSKKVVIKLLKPIFGGGALTEREVMHEKIFTEEVHGRQYQAAAREWATTHAGNVGHIDGLDESLEREVILARKKAA